MVSSCFYCAICIGKERLIIGSADAMGRKELSLVNLEGLWIIFQKKEQKRLKEVS